VDTLQIRAFCPRHGYHLATVPAGQPLSEGRYSPTPTIPCDRCTEPNLANFQCFITDFGENTVLLKVRGNEYLDVPGQYKLTFLGTRESNHEQYGAGVEFQFKVAEGPYAGKLVSRTTSPDITPKNATRKMLVGLGADIKSGAESIDDAPFIGKSYVGIVEPKQSGKGCRVASVVPVVRKFWFKDAISTEPLLLTEREIQDCIDANSADGISVMAEGKLNDWHAPVAMGFRVNKA
jgi:hypothetical protein